MDKIFEAFLRRQQEQGEALAKDSDRFRLHIGPGAPPQSYIVVFHCQGLVRSAQSEVTVAEEFAVGINFPSDYLRRADAAQVLTWLAPAEIFHPNIRAPFICVGRLAPGTALVDIIYQVFEIITWNKVTMREDDALNHDACVWARNNQQQFPVDTRPLKRTAAESQNAPFAGVVIEEVNQG